MSTNEVSETVINLIDNGRVNWPRSISERNKFITENFSKVWDALLDINIDANAEVFSHADDELYGTSPYGACEKASGRAWDALSEILMLIIVLEDALGIDITPISKYDDKNHFAVEKAKVRQRLRP